MFLPGVGDTLNQTVAAHWQESESLSAHIYLGQRGQPEVMLYLSSLTPDQRRLLTERPVIVDAGVAHHRIDGFGVRIPGIVVTPTGTAIAVCQQRVGSVADGGHETNVLVSRSEDGGRTWADAEVMPRSGYSWHRWEYDWQAPEPGHYVLMARATNAKGEVQPMEFPNKWDGLNYGNNMVFPLDVRVVEG